VFHCYTDLVYCKFNADVGSEQSLQQLLLSMIMQIVIFCLAVCLCSACKYMSNAV
jgi:hypothetical protein